MIKMLFLMILLLVGLSWYVIYDPNNMLDQNIIIWIQQFHTDEVLVFAKWLAILGGLPAVLVFLMCVIGHGCLKKNWSLVSFSLLSVLSTAALTWILKVIFSRPRPVVEMQWVETYGGSFPSGHSAYAMTIACILLYLGQCSQARILLIVFAMSWPLAMGMSRIYLGVHYLTDVFAGWLVALIAVFVVKMTLNRFSTI